MSSVDSYRQSQRELNGRAPQWLRTMRDQAMARFADLGFPTTRMEEWKYTNVAPIERTAFRPAPPLAAARAGDLVAAARLGPRGGEPVGVQLVFLNGRLAPSLSSTPALPAGVRIASLAAALADGDAALEPHLGGAAGEDAFASLNTAFIDDGALVSIGDGVSLDEPIHLLFISGGDGEPVVSHPRVLIVLGRSAEATVIETHLGGPGPVYFANCVTEVFLGANAGLAHYKVQREADTAYHVGRVDVRQERDSRLASFSVSLGGALVRTDIGTVLGGEGGQCSLDGLYMVGGRQHADHHTSIDHQAGNCSSRELYKGVLDGRSTAVFNGKVYVRPQAQKSDAQQMNKNLLLSDNAVVDTKPQLEIFADDVKCSHGATIGRLDEDALFYLRSRGIDAATARDVLIFAFANELVGRMRSAPVSLQVEEILRRQFHRDSESEATP